MLEEMRADWLKIWRDEHIVKQWNTIDDGVKYAKKILDRYENGSYSDRHRKHEPTKAFYRKWSVQRAVEALAKVEVDPALEKMKLEWLAIYPSDTGVTDKWVTIADGVAYAKSLTFCLSGPRGKRIEEFILRWDTYREDYVEFDEDDMDDDEEEDDEPEELDDTMTDEVRDEKLMCNARTNGYHCTRMVLHTGPHQAGIQAGRSVHTWVA